MHFAGLKLKKRKTQEKEEQKEDKEKVESAKKISPQGPITQPYAAPSQTPDVLSSEKANSEEKPKVCGYIRLLHCLATGMGSASCIVFFSRVLNTVSGWIEQSGFCQVSIWIEARRCQGSAV